LDKGYVIEAIYEIWQYELTEFDQRTKTGGFFTEYISKYYKQKTLASGLPPECTDDESIDRYIRRVKETEDIELEKGQIKKIPRYEASRNYV